MEARKFVCPLHCLPESNLSWGSLTMQLPFEDDEFDHVHIHAIARAVPENKVSFVVFLSSN